MVRVTETLRLFSCDGTMVVQLVAKDATDKGVPLTEITDHRSKAQGPAYVPGLEKLYEKFQKARRSQLYLFMLMALACVVAASFLLSYTDLFSRGVALVLLTLSCIFIVLLCRLATDFLKDGDGNVLNIRSGVITTPDGSSIVATHGDDHGV